MSVKSVMHPGKNGKEPPKFPILLRYKHKNDDLDFIVMKMSTRAMWIVWVNPNKEPIPTYQVGTSLNPATFFEDYWTAEEFHGEVCLRGRGYAK